MTDSPTRRELERAVRALIPSDLNAPKSMMNQSPNGATAGLGGLFTGYLWGWRRGRRTRRARKNREN